MHIRSAMTSYCLQLVETNLKKYWSSVLETWRHNCASKMKQSDTLSTKGSSLMQEFNLQEWFYIRWPPKPAYHLVFFHILKKGDFNCISSSTFSFTVFSKSSHCKIHLYCTGQLVLVSRKIGRKLVCPKSHFQLIFTDLKPRIDIYSSYW